MGILQRDDVGGGFYLSATLNPASIAAGAAADVTVSDADVRSGDLVVIASVPTGLEADVNVLGIHTVADGSFKVRLSNNDDTNAIDAASGTWEFLVFRR